MFLAISKGIKGGLVFDMVRPYDVGCSNVLNREKLIISDYSCV